MLDIIENIVIVELTDIPVFAGLKKKIGVSKYLNSRKGLGYSDMAKMLTKIAHSWRLGTNWEKKVIVILKCQSCLHKLTFSNYFM